MVNKLGSICAVYGCCNYKRQIGDKKSFFRMPKDYNRLKSWIVACKREDLNSLLECKDSDYFYKNYSVCSDHFDLECFRNKKLFSQGLLPGSTPTLKLFEGQSAIKRKILDTTEEIKATKIRVDENSNEEFAGAEMENESKHFCIEEMSKEKFKFKLAENEIINKEYQDLNNKENQEENIDEEIRRKIILQDYINKLNISMNLDTTTFNKLFEKLNTDIKKLLPNTSTKRKIEKQCYYPQTQKRQKNSN